MSVKGEKGFSLPKPSLKSTPPSSKDGKDDSSPKTKKGRRVQFDSEGSREPKSNFSSKFYRAAAASGKADWCKGGKGDTVANAKKKEPQPLELKIEQELPRSVKCMMYCEAANILQGMQEQMVMLSKDPTIKIPVSFDKGLQYANSNSLYTHPQSGRHVLETLKKYGVKDGEICVIANVCPETTDEVFALVPSLKNAFPKLFGVANFSLPENPYCARTSIPATTTREPTASFPTPPSTSEIALHTCSKSGRLD